MISILEQNMKNNDDKERVRDDDEWRRMEGEDGGRECRVRVRVRRKEIVSIQALLSLKYY